MKLFFIGWKAEDWYKHLPGDATVVLLITADLVKALSVVEPMSMLLLAPFEFWLGGFPLEWDWMSRDESFFVTSPLLL